MRRFAPFLVLAALAFTVVVLALNLRERDAYLEGKSSPPPGPVNVDPADPALAWLPLRTEHDGCVHPAEFSTNHRWARVRDFDGWHRLFWAADEHYYFEDPSALNQAMNNSTARDPAGEWRIELAYRPPAGCARPPVSLRFRYRLEATPGAGATGSPPQRLRWFVGRSTSASRTIEWILEDSWVTE